MKVFDFYEGYSHSIPVVIYYSNYEFKGLN